MTNENNYMFRINKCLLQALLSMCAHSQLLNPSMTPALSSTPPRKQKEPEAGSLAHLTVDRLSRRLKAAELSLSPWQQEDSN